MGREKEIEEMARIIRGAPFSDMQRATALYNGGYRKQKTGHWFILGYDYFTCSECGYYHPSGCDSTKEAKEKLAEGKVPKYCDECGSKMKGGER